ncbi:MAG: hypothetical protein CMH64_01050 [Nanoarchaeota archaeon]|nr:hypothetical protein [Nanoarchaeota archaeon]|tara:strand:- start:1756 stop:2337 length:582 start_codon:yes stop_codon:yes gene_type:complete
MKKLTFSFIILIFLVFLVGCVEKGNPPRSILTPDENSLPNPVFDEDVQPKETTSWQNTPLKDVSSGKSFKISDFRGKNILLESFAVWCPVCTKQQKEIQKLHNDPNLAIIELDTDPNEDETKVLEHINRNNFKGLYAVAPKSLSDALVDEFGLGVISAPSAPVVLICEDGSSRFLKRGVKKADKLREEIAAGC